MIDAKTAFPAALEIDDTVYETLPTRKYLQRRPYVPHDPRRVLCFIPGIVQKIYVKSGQKIAWGEHLLILEGSLTLRLGDRTYEMSAGNYVCFPAGQKAAHALINQGAAPCRYLLIGERNPSDVIVYPDSGRVGVRLTGEGYRKSATMEYWDDQPTQEPA